MSFHFLSSLPYFTSFRLSPPPPSGTTSSVGKLPPRELLMCGRGRKRRVTKAKRRRRRMERKGKHKNFPMKQRRTPGAKTINCFQHSIYHKLIIWLIFSSVRPPRRDSLEAGSGGHTTWGGRFMVIFSAFYRAWKNFVETRDVSGRKLGNGKVLDEIVLSIW